MGAWDLYKQAKTNEHSPAWLQWMASAWLMAIVAGSLWFRFCSTAAENHEREEAVGSESSGAGR